MIEEWGHIKVDTDKIWKDSINELKTQIISMNQNQLLAGFDAKGMKLPPYSSPYARRKGKPIQPKTLKDKGSFHKGFYALAFDEFVEIGSRDWKESFLESKWGNIHGLTDENLQELIIMFKPIYTRNFINAILTS
jgi:hypothetical protein